MTSIVVVGSINRDIVARVARHPAPGETVLAATAQLYPGGKGANQAVSAARLKDAATRVRLIGRVGRDGHGAALRTFIAAEGIDTSDIADVATGTGFAFITVDAAGENAITVVSGANMDWPRACPPLGLNARDVLVCQLEVPLAIVASAFEQARAAHATTILNAAPYQTLPPKLLAATDVIVVNEIELAQLLGRDVDGSEEEGLVAAARAVIALGPRSVVVTLGAAGALALDQQGRAERIRGIAASAVDTTGAGDCFVGALAAALVDGLELAAACQFANCAAAISVTRDGAASSMPRRTEIS
jgi:ribokinase